MSVKTSYVQTIVTEFIPCTNTRPSRVKATAEAGSVVVSWDHALNVDENHARACEALIEKMQWKRLGDCIGGQLPKGGYAFVFIDRVNK